MVQRFCMCLVVVEGIDHVPRGVLLGVLPQYGALDPMIRAFRSLYDWCHSLIRIADSRLDSFPVRVGPRQGCLLSPILFKTFLDRISRWFWWGHPIVFFNLNGAVWSECAAIEMRISTSKSEAMVLVWKSVESLFSSRSRKRSCPEESKYLWHFFHQCGRMEQEINRQISTASAVI